MLGAIAGDIIGSRFEKDNNRSINFELFHPDCRFTDDSVLTVAVADAILQDAPYERMVREYSLRYPDAGYGKTFKKWMTKEIKGPYNSWGNGSAMRVSPVGWAFDQTARVQKEAIKSAEITHNHHHGLDGAKAIALAVYNARSGKSKKVIKALIEDSFGYDLDTPITEIRKTYTFDVSCQGSVPQAIRAFLEGTDFEETIRLAISIGGDSDTIAAMAGSVAEAFYGELPEDIETEIRNRLPDEFLRVIHKFYAKFGG